MFRSLHLRLLLSYIAVILACLILVGFGLLLFLRASPVWTRAAYLQLEAKARAAIPQILSPEQLRDLSPREFGGLLAQSSQEQGVRIILLDEQQKVLFDSEDTWSRQRLERVSPGPIPLGPSRGKFISPDGDPWIFVGQAFARPNGGQLALLFISRQNALSLLGWFAENLLLPLAEAGLVALVLSIPLAWLISHSVAKPLEQVASAAEAIAQGDLSQRAPVSGPHEVRDLARAFNRMAARVGATQQAQRDFIANVSHELKTPLTSIQGFSQAILDGTAAGDAMGMEQSAQVIYDEAERMRRMVDALLSLARFDAGQVETAQEPVDVASLLSECVERLRPQAEDAGDALVLSVPPELRVTGDADWLAQLFTNLLDNAIRHTQDGRVEVEATRVDDGIEVTFTDTGEGIPPQDLSRVFERFYQADKSRRRKGGVGLGLAIAREVARLHGGDIEVESVVGLGSRFTVRLPAQKG